MGENVLGRDAGGDGRRGPAIKEMKMPDFSKILTATSCLFLVVGCTQNEEPQPIYPEPIYNKYGNVVGCSDGSTVTGSTADNPCKKLPPPPDGCDETSTPGTADDPCAPPPGENRDPDDSSTTGGGRDPGRGSSTPGGSSSTGGSSTTGGSSSSSTPPGTSP